MDFADRAKVAHFQRRLAETIGWCASQDWTADSAEALSITQLHPPEIMDSG